jgi:putative endonuclease
VAGTPVEREYFVYILASERNGTLYIGVTNDLIRRIHEHKSDVVAGFTEKYGVHRLVHFESFSDVELAIQREKNLKHWVRRWKVELIEKTNPTWRDLYEEVAAG